MPTTSTKDLVRQLNQSSLKTKKGEILVPLVEDFYQNPVEVEDDEDIKFVEKVLKVRSLPRRKGIYSPSMLSECVRRVYFIKTEKPQRRARRVESHGYFADGNWRHLKWQFTLWKMHRAGIIQLIDRPAPYPPGTEIFTLSNRGDSGGTTDNLLYIPSIDWLGVVDWKGMNSTSFVSYVGAGHPPISYIAQSVDYALHLNEDQNIVLPRKIQNVLVIGENKNGAIRSRTVKSPLGLYEWHYQVEDFVQHIARRKKKLRTYEKRKEVPPPECISTSRRMFTDCPFSYFCRGEVERIEKLARKNGSLDKKSQKPKVKVHRDERKKPKRI